MFTPRPTDSSHAATGGHRRPAERYISWPGVIKPTYGRADAPVRRRSIEGVPEESVAEECDEGSEGSGRPSLQSGAARPAAGGSRPHRALTEERDRKLWR